MANEAVCIETPTKFARYKVTDGLNIPMGTLLKLSGADLFAEASSAQDLFAGIAWEEKTASDGLTEITAAIDGVWDLTAGLQTITQGGICSLSGANLIKQALEAEMVTGAFVGKVLEGASASEVVRVRVGSMI
jgi:hypothetical protein